MAAADYMPWAEMKSLVAKMEGDLKKSSSAKGYTYKPSHGRMSLLIHMGCHVALRISDLVKLTWDDVSTENGNISGKIVRIEQKTGKKRKIAVHKDIQAHLARYRKRCQDPTGFIFKGRNGAHISPRYVNYELQRIKDKYKVSVNQFSTHTLRKTWAREVWERSGRDSGVLEMLSMALNHSSTQKTRIYLGITEQDIDELYLSL